MGKKRVVTKTGTDNAKIKDRITKLANKAVKGKRLEKGRVYITVSYNNTNMVLTDLQGNVVAWTSAGTLGFRGPKKSTPFAAAKVAEALIQKVGKIGLKNVEVYVQGIGGGRESGIRALVTQGLEIDLIKDVTPVPHNGPRSPKPRRI